MIAKMCFTFQSVPDSGLKYVFISTKHKRKCAICRFVEHIRTRAGLHVGSVSLWRNPGPPLMYLLVRDRGVLRQQGLAGSTTCRQYFKPSISLG